MVRCRIVFHSQIVTFYLVYTCIAFRRGIDFRVIRLSFRSCERIPYRRVSCLEMCLHRRSNIDHLGRSEGTHEVAGSSAHGFSK